MPRSGARIRRPSVRESWLKYGQGSTDATGSEAFVEVGWDEAFHLVANELDRVRTNFGTETIYGGSYGWGSPGRFHHANHKFTASSAVLEVITYPFHVGRASTGTDSCQPANFSSVMAVPLRPPHPWPACLR
ncbi:molybdopterin-dependent oxidoreductase [Arthrobacter sp. 49Tsu3.1M3]|uniref:molybdopterin-dependent oxidoreductase n=1 Tax=Arthrobacter sp. 49Tsu3.1M3 TaxID=1279029 RepID=UPI00356256FC